MISVLIVGLFLLLVQPVQAVDVPSYTASPSAQPVPTATVTPTIKPGNLCTGLQVTSGQGAMAPQTVGFQTNVSHTDQVSGYRYHFGDGNTLEGGSQIVHRYALGGSYTAYVEVKDSAGNWQTSDTCSMQVQLKNPPLVAGQLTCSELVLVSGNNEPAPVEVEARVDAAGPTQNIAGYQIDFGDGTVIDASTSSVLHTYTSPGTYVVSGKIKDLSGTMIGGTGTCQQEAKILSAKPLTTQPQTGVSPWAWTAIFGLLSVGIWARKLAYAEQHHGSA